MLLHEFRHVDAYHRLLGVEHEFGQGLAELGLADAGGAQEHERAARPIRIRQARPRAANGIGHRFDRFVLAHHALVEDLLHSQQFIALALEHARHRNAGPLRHDLGNLHFGHGVAQQLIRLLLHFERLRKTLLERRNAPILQLRHARQVLCTPRRIDILAGPLQFLLDVRGALHRRLLGLPHLFQVRVLLLERLERVFQRGETLARGLVGLLLERLALDFQLDDAPIELVQRLRLRVDLHANQRTGLIDQIDGLVRQLTVRDVAIREGRRRDDGRVGDFDAVMHFVAFFEPAQDGDGVFHRRLIDQHLLKTPLERRVLLDVLAILVERGRADAMQFAARQGGLQHVAGVHRALGLARAHHGVQLVDEQNDLPLLFGQIVEHGFQALLEFAAEFSARDQRAHVERENALVAEALGHFTVDDPLCQSLDDGRLADAGLADEHGIVLGTALQDLDGAADFIVAPDDRIEFALARAFGEVDAVLLQRLTVLLGAGVLHLGAAPHFVDGGFQGRTRRTGRLQDAPQLTAVLAGREHEQLAGNELIAALLRQLVGDVEQLVQIVAQQHLARRAFDFRQPLQGGRQLRTQLGHVGARFLEQRPRGAALLVEQGRHQVHGLDVLIVAAHRERLGIRQRRLELRRQFIHPHRYFSLEKSPGMLSKWGRL